MCVPYTQRRLPSPANLSSAARSGFPKVKAESRPLWTEAREVNTGQNHWRPEYSLCAKYFEISVLLQILLLFKDLLIYLMCLGVLPACMSVGGRQKPWELESQTLMSYHVVLGTESGPSGRAASALN